MSTFSRSLCWRAERSDAGLDSFDVLILFIYGFARVRCFSNGVEDNGTALVSFLIFSEKGYRPFYAA